MGYQSHIETLESLSRKIHCILLNGPPNSRKTSSARTIPGNVIIQSYPLEKGTTSIPWKNFEGKPIQSFAWERIDISQPVNWTEVWTETRKKTVDILTGKHGTCDAFFGDGIHKLYQVILAHVTNGANILGQAFDAKAYSVSHAIFFEYVDLVYSSPVPWKVLTCWDGLEVDNPEDARPEKEGGKGSKASKHVYPDLPGQAAKKIMGETSVVLYADQDGGGDSARHFWRTRAAGRVWGAGTKLPVDLMTKINLPKEVDQDFNKLDRLIMGQIEKEFASLKEVK